MLKKVNYFSVWILISSLFLLNNQLQADYLSNSLKKESKQVIKEEKYRSKAQVDFIHVASLATKSVVHVQCFGTVTLNKGQFKHPLEEFLKEFFNDRFYEENKGDTSTKKEERLLSTGSGVIISADGYLITNNHVIQNAEKIMVTLDDKTPYQVEIVNKDPITDLAILKIINPNKGKKPLNLPYLKFGSSDELAVGEWVLAIGNPFSLTSTVTEGIVSAKARGGDLFTMPTENNKPSKNIYSFIQTSAAVNKGNSGGALVNLSGELVGIVTAIMSNNNTFIGYAFAIPSSIAQKVAHDIIHYKVVKRAYLGVSLISLDAEPLKAKKLSVFNGAYIATPPSIDSPAGKAGLRQDDIIVGVNQQKIKNTQELQEKIAQYNPGDNVELEILRNNKIKKLEVTLGKMSEAPSIIYTNQNKELEIAGATFEDLTGKVKEALGIQNGVKIKKIQEGKFKQSGIKKGLVITKINNIPVLDIVHLGKLFHNFQSGEGVFIRAIDVEKLQTVHFALTWGEA